MKLFKDYTGQVFGYDDEQILMGLAIGKTAMTDAEVQAHLNPPLTVDQIKSAITEATQVRLDQFAQTRGYDGIMSACTYANSTTAKFKTEGDYCLGARDQTWGVLYQIMADVQAGTRPMPSGYADIEPELPVLTWPN